MIVFIVLLNLIITITSASQGQSIFGNPMFHGNPCVGIDYIVSSFSPGFTDGYTVNIKRNLKANIGIKLKFDSEASIIVKMMKLHIMITILLILSFCCITETATSKEGSIATFPVFSDKACIGIDYIDSTFSPGFNDGYRVNIRKHLEANTAVRLKFDSDASIVVDHNVARLALLKDNVFKLIPVNDTDDLEFSVKGQIYVFPPYIVSLKIKGMEHCSSPNFGYFEHYPSGAEPRPKVPDMFCGRRKVSHSQLIVNGEASKAGDWPWHVALYRISRGTLKYVCGGTLISKFHILTAAHCVTSNGLAVLPESVGVSLGKYHLIGGDAAPQEREVFDVIVHEEFGHKTLDNDIALLKMKTAVEFTHFVQPACIWFDKVAEKLSENEDVIGTVAGWGFDQTDSLSTTLREATMPIISDIYCIRSNPLFYASFLNGNRFCAGHHNGTSPCNGDSGGGFYVYIPYVNNSGVHPLIAGAYYVRGIVSLSASKPDTSLCDPTQYTLFTDVSAYMNWIMDNMD